MQNPADEDDLTEWLHDVGERRYTTSAYYDPLETAIRVNGFSKELDKQSKKNQISIRKEGSVVYLVIGKTEYQIQKKGRNVCLLDGNLSSVLGNCSEQIRASCSLFLERLCSSPE